MTTDAKFKKERIVRYWTSDTEWNPAVILEVTNPNPAQYHVFDLKTGERTVCGEGINEPGAVSEL